MQNIQHDSHICNFSLLGDEFVNPLYLCRESSSNLHRTMSCATSFDEPRFPRELFAKSSTLEVKVMPSLIPSKDSIVLV